MISKDKNVWGYTTFTVTDKMGNSFEILEGGNLDLFWVANCKGNQADFTIDKSNKEMYRLLKILFKNIKIRDDKNNPRLVDNVFTWTSEDRPDANILKIVDNEDCFKIEFLKHENNFYKICSICFCNSGSKFQKVEQLFMEMYIYLCNKENINETGKEMV